MQSAPPRPSTFCLTDMLTADGAFAASYDADSEGEEGRYYVWSYTELEQLLPTADFDLFCETYDAHAGRKLGRPHHPQPLRRPGPA